MEARFGAGDFALILIKILCSTHYYPHFTDEAIAAQEGNLPKAPNYEVLKSASERRSGSGLK